MILGNYLCSFFLIALGFYCMATQHNLFKCVIGMGLADYGVNLLVVTVGFNPGGTAPIFAIDELTRDSFFVDPIPQALTLTSIVIGACTTAMMLAIVVMIKKKYGTVNTDEIRRLRG